MADRYIDNTKESGTLTGANWQCTNGSTTVTESGAAGNALAELSAGDYFRTTGGTQWYKVASVTDNDNFEIAINFQQGTVTAAGKFNNEDGSAVGQEFPHLNAATTDEVRSAGDIVRVRGGQTHVYAGIDITFDEKATVNNYIEVRGIYTAAGDDSWGDGDTTKPSIDFDNTAFQILVNNDYYWKFLNLDIKQSTDALGAIYFSAGMGGIVDNCDIHDNGSSGLRSFNTPIQILNSTFMDNISQNLIASNSIAIIRNCTFNGGAGGTTIGLLLISTIATIVDSTFGVTTEHSSGDISLGLGGCQIAGRNVILGSTAQVIGQTIKGQQLNYVRIEDDSQTHLAFQAWYFTGNVIRTTAVERSGEGGTDWSILGEPNSNCGSEQPLYIMGDWIRGMPIYLDGTEQTITVYAYADSTGGGWTPNASEFRIEVEHYEGAADWELDVSTDTFAAEDQWEAFSITLTPGAAGPAYLRAVLNDYAAGGKVYVDPTPILS